VRTYTTAEDRAYAWKAAMCAKQAKPKGWEPLTGPCCLTIRVVQKMPGPASWKRKQKLGHWSSTKPDLDNVLKLIADSLIGIGFVDDRQVARAVVQKRIGDQGEAPCVEVELGPMAESHDEMVEECAHT
jgi:Holliday junction resolvase RusA-like endonuclease